MPADLWQRAASFAARAHRHQLRKDNQTPYAAHPFRVAMTVAQVFGCDDERALAIALLHDTIEDTATDFEDLAESFGREVAAGVAALTKHATLPEPERERDYDARLARADWRCRLVKLADTFDNLSDHASRADGAEVAKVAGKARRAIALAAPDAADHPPVARGIAALRALLRRLGPSVTAGRRSTRRPRSRPAARGR